MPKFLSAWMIPAGIPSVVKIDLNVVWAPRMVSRIRKSSGISEAPAVGGSPAPPNPCRCCRSRPRRRRPVGPSPRPGRWCGGVRGTAKTGLPQPNWPSRHTSRRRPGPSIRRIALRWPRWPRCSGRRSSSPPAPPAGCGWPRRRRGHRHGMRQFVGRRGGAGLRRGLLCPFGGRVQPAHVGGGAGRHRPGRGPVPIQARQAGEHRFVHRGRDAQLRRQRVPAPRGGQQRTRPGASIHPGRVHLWRKEAEIHCPTSL